MTIKNTRLWEAVNALVYGEGDARSRVCVACEILDKLNNKELPPDLQARLEKVKNEAGKKGAFRNIKGDVVINRYTHTSKTRTNKTYSKLAKEIFAIHNDLNNR